MPRSGKLNRFIACPLELEDRRAGRLSSVEMALRRLRRSRRNGAAALALAFVLAAGALTLAGVLAGAAVPVLLRSAAALAFAGVLAIGALALATIEAFTSVLVVGLFRVVHLDCLRRGLVETEGVRLRLIGTKTGSGAEAGDNTTENEITSEIATIHETLLLNFLDCARPTFGESDWMRGDVGR